ncbi:arabinosyltransferase domain-containing protein [Nocardia sp. NPDC058480]|uniref:arabinosyltransferase domain-containing protein n=1 Tax=unclassified Nocardia TaxID=2637762 RepID=UPI0036531CA1
MTLLLSRRRPSDDQPFDPQDQQQDSGRLWRIVAIVAGIVGVLLALAVPFLPVQQQQASFSWPQDGRATSVTSPLVSYSPVSVDATIPCAATSGLSPRGGYLMATVPPASGQAWHYGLNVLVATADAGNRLQVVLRDKTLVDTAVVDLSADCRVSVVSTSARTTVEVSGSEPVIVEGDFRPQLVGLFTDLAGDVPAGMRTDVEIDSRFTTAPTALKLIAIIGVFIAAAVALFALHRLDCRDGRRNRRVLPQRWWRPRWVDGVVIGTLILWYFIGAGTADDGYILGMARTAGHAGYLANYFAYFGVPETPIGIPYDLVVGWLAQISTASIVVRLPELMFGIVCWFLISREVVPRLGIAARQEKAAIWAGGLALLAFWLPYNNGLRPEPAVALGVLLVWVSMERTLATRRLAPAAIALIPAALAVVTNPAGVICFAALLAGARPLVQIIVERARSVGYLALLAPAAAVGVSILALVFIGQPFSEVSAMSDAHAVVGPNMPWYDETFVYQSLFQVGPDGSMARRFAMLLLFLTLAVSVLALVRHGGRIPGLAAGPTRRILGTTVATIPLMALSPTKFTHHFGVFAGLAGAVAVVAAVAAGPRVVRSPRNRALFAAVVTAVLALAFTSSNSWWYVAAYGIPWWDKPISVKGTSAGTALLIVAILLLAFAGWLHIREPFRSAEHRTHRRIPALTITVGLVVAFEVVSFVKAGIDQYPAYSLAKSNFSALAGEPCGLADEVLVEPDPNAGMLQPLSGDRATALGADNDGFTPNGVNTNDLVPDASDAASASVGQSLGSAGTTTESGSTEGGGLGGSSPRGINGSTLALPFGLDPAATPVLGSFGSPGVTKTLVSGWYRLPAPDSSGSRGQILAIATAGRVATTDLDGLPVIGQSVEIEYGSTSAAEVVPLGRVIPDDVSVLQPSWRNLRVPLQQLPSHADAVRIVATVNSSDAEQWVAVTPPRVPDLRTLDELVGHTRPVLLDWLVGLQFPCQQPMRHRYGVAEIPEYRILPEFSAAIMTSNWQSHASGGPLGYTDLVTRTDVLPSYLKDDWKRNWGEIHRLVPFEPTATPAELDTVTVDRSARWTPGPINFGIR